MKTGDTALIMLGCPKYPVQGSIATYLTYKLKKNGIDAVVAGTPAAVNLFKVADPEKHYCNNFKNIERCIGDIADGKTTFPVCFALVHNDAGVSYATTASVLLDTEMYVIVFGEEAEDRALEITFPATKIVVPASHNPMPVKKKIDEVISWAV